MVIHYHILLVNTLATSSLYPIAADSHVVTGGAWRYYAMRRQCELGQQQARHLAFAAHALVHT